MVTEYPPFTFGGIGTFTQNLSEALTKEGVEVVVVAGWPKKHPMQVFDKTHRLKILWVPRGSLAPTHLWFQLRNVDLLCRELSVCDVVHGQDIYAFPLLQLFKRRRLKTPWIITFHTNPQAELYFAIKSVLRGGSLTDLVTYGAAFPLWDSTVRQHFKYADGLVSVSKSLGNELSFGYKLDRGLLKAIHTCVRIDELRARETSTSQRSTTGRIRLLYAGRLYYRKGILQLMRILKDLADEPEGRNINLSVFGRGPLEQVLRKYIADNLTKISVTIRGYVDRVTLLQELSASDIVCLPSLYEACPVLMIEAISMGKPVVAFDLPFAREILGDVEELLASDIDDFRIKLVRLISSREERSRLGKRMRERSEDFDALRIAAEYQEVYEELI
jgi:glycosyltransferase involved in cell wall biosynthesis